MDEKVLLRTESRFLYSPEEMKRFDKVIRVFYNYLRDSQNVELVWSDKVGYVLIPLDVDRRRAESGTKVILDAGALVEALLQEIAMDVACDAGKRRLSRKEYPEYRRRTQGYLEQLPEYAASAWTRAG